MTHAITHYHSRRAFLRLAALASAGLAAACGTRRQNPTTTGATPSPGEPTNPPEASPTAVATTAAASIAILGGDAEVWAWETRVTGQVTGGACDAVEVRAGETAVQAEIEGDTFSATLPLQAGENNVTAACLPADARSEPVTITASLRNAPRSHITIALRDGGILLAGGESEPAPQDGSPIPQYRWSTRAANPEPLVMLDGNPVEGFNFADLAVQAPQQDGEYYLSLTVTDQDGREDTSTTYFRVADGEPSLDDWATQNVDWIENAVVYGVVPKKFGSKPFINITERLDYLASLGVNALWLAPVTDSPPGDYGYAVRDYFTLRSQYGTPEDFKAMIDAAHRRGIRVLMDFVPNHSSITHRYFMNAVNRGKASHSWDFYDRDETGNATYYFDWNNLPNLNYDNPEVQAWMTEAFSYWVREFDVDGFRVDVAWGIRERKPEYWPTWRQALKRIKPDLLLIAEASARDEFYFTEGFDAAYDWTSQLGHWAWELVWDEENLLTYNLDAALRNPSGAYHPDALIFRFLNNNDTGDRFITKYGIDRYRVALAMLLTLPGIPCLFTGDEVGAEYTPYGDAFPLDFEDRDGLFAYHQELIRLRHETPALHSRAWAPASLEPHQQVYGYYRYLPGDAENAPALVLLNFFDQPADVTVDIPDDLAPLANVTLTDRISGQAVPAGSPITLTLPAYGVMVLQAQ